VMEFLSGEDLAALLKTKALLPIEEALDLFRQIAGAMDAAHAVGIVHRDLKPSNIFLQKAGEHRIVKVLDFGIAKLLDAGSNDGVQTNTGVIMGTPLYMAPEQATGNIAQISPRSDIYSLGVILYQMLSGNLPILAATPVQILVAQVSSPPVPLETVAPDLPPGVYAAVERSLRKDPAKRYQTAGAFFEAFAAAVRPPHPPGKNDSDSRTETDRAPQPKAVSALPGAATGPEAHLGFESTITQARSRMLLEVSRWNKRFLRSKGHPLMTRWIRHSNPRMPRTKPSNRSKYPDQNRGASDSSWAWDSSWQQPSPWQWCSTPGPNRSRETGTHGRQAIPHRSSMERQATQTAGLKA